MNEAGDEQAMEKRRVEGSDSPHIRECPFCGSPWVNVWGLDNRSFGVTCICFALGPVRETVGAAIEAWNVRLPGRKWDLGEETQSA